MTEGPLLLVTDIGGTTVKLGAVRDGRIHASTERHETARLDPADPAATLARWISDFAATQGLRPDLHVVTVPASISADFQRVLKAANVPCLEGRPLRAELADRLGGGPVLLERDVDVLLLGEMAHHRMDPTATALGVFLGTGIGASCISGGRVYRGSGQGMQLGLAPIRGEGLERPWARRDTLEVYASGRAMQDRAEAGGFAIEDFFEVAAQDRRLSAWFEACLRDQILHIATAALLMAPDVLVLGGGVLDLRGYPFDRLVAGLRGYTMRHDTGEELPVLRSTLGWKAAMLGAERVAGARP